MEPTGRWGTKKRAGSQSDFLVKLVFDEDLGNSAYLVASRSSKEAVLIDPLRDVNVYLEAARKERLTVTHALDTHLHNDFLSGCREVAARTGAEIGVSAEARESAALRRRRFLGLHCEPVETLK